MDRPEARQPAIDPTVRLPDAPVIVADHHAAMILESDGSFETMEHAAAARRALQRPPILCHAKSTARHLKIRLFPAFDLLELFAFVRPAQFCVPTPRGLADALGLEFSKAPEDIALGLVEAARALLSELAGAKQPAGAIAWSMAAGNWPWGRYALAAIDGDQQQRRPNNPAEGLRVWTRLKEWSESAPPPAPGHQPVSEEEVLERLRRLLGDGAEDRPQQIDYAIAAAHAFQPTGADGTPLSAITEAGTGVGKTLGYIGPASVWAEKNEAAVWVSTYTRNLQRQLDGELDRLYPDPSEKALRAVVRKGRENYLCLLNLEEAVHQASGDELITLGLTARWAAASRDGDMIGGDFPAWLADLLGRRRTIDLTDTRGECIYSGCTHYGKCFIEKSVRRARRARIVIANHALVLIQAALGAPGGGGDDTNRPTRYVFDEGHHLFSAADSAFSAHLTGLELAELRRWLIGADTRRSSRARGLRARTEGLLGESGAAAEALDDLLRAAHGLPNQGWMQRLAEGAPHGPSESFLILVRAQVYARDANAKSSYGLECDVAPAVEGLNDAARSLSEHLETIIKPAQRLTQALHRRLDDEADELDTATRSRIEAIIRSLERRAIGGAGAWRAMLAALEDETPEEYVDFFAVERIDGRDFDTGMHRHWVDPMIPFAEQVGGSAHGLLITSATLSDSAGDIDPAEQDPTEPDPYWASVAHRTGAAHLEGTPIFETVESPFDYPAQTRVLIVSDIEKNDIGQLAAANRELMLAAGGGALGLFTSIQRLRGVHEKLAASEKFAAMSLFAQHVDGLDTGTLVDIFRAEEDACLLGTDAVRDGVDVPGRALRLIVFDRVPWPRPTLLHKARKAAYEGGRYDDMITRLRLKQAFGRLVRKGGDRGVFALLDRATPSRLLSAFPDGVEISRLGLKDAVEATRNFLEGS
ncbi:MAG: ATP-dependent DNA helicase [Alphaproteobacteria bacterium]|jgi:ATP-dependent DNA helicase DinG|nr:helicase [Rhodospirillaceae bacterium]MDP6430601.1 ATP-dependent DNA helicase [Rhodospirillales bacterium]MDP6644060.1 ATP-dependent DNA helicase [Rhodospirillales bacterium]MDP6819653.1 ATP-dependent DNA helicase [Alphaproteobacteria bacterium]